MYVSSPIYLFIFIHFTFVIMLNAICITTNQLEHIQTNLCIHLSYLEDQRNLKIYNKNIKKKKCMYVCTYNIAGRDPVRDHVPVSTPLLLKHLFTAANPCSSA